VQKQVLPIFSFIFFTAIVLNFSCTKLDTTDIGGDVIPAIDNIKTFADTLDVITTQGVFDDTTGVTSADDHVLGAINNGADPLFGTTFANVFVQLKPAFFPYYFSNNATDTINNSLLTGTGFDSIVLCLSYKGFWGDSMQQQQLEVREILNSPNNNGKWDSLFFTRNVKYAPQTGNVIAKKSLFVTDLNKFVKFNNGKDSSKNQIRIRLTLNPSSNSSSPFEAKIFNNYSDTLSSSITKYFRTDSAFKFLLNGLGVYAADGGGLMYCNLADTNTKLQVFFRRKVGATIDTTYTSFKLNSGAFSAITPSATANNIVRNRPALPSGNEEVFIQTNPGTYANVRIPALSTYSNKIIHRADLLVEQIPSNAATDKAFAAPIVLYMDLVATNTPPLKWKPIPFDLNPTVGYDPDDATAFYPTGGVDIVTFGPYRRERTDLITGLPQSLYNFNVSRHVQQIVTKKTTNYDFRMYAPFAVTYPQYSPLSIRYGNALANGRVKLGGGSNNNIKYRMKLRVVYSIL
jgi:hypothetical protein